MSTSTTPSSTPTAPAPSSQPTQAPSSPQSSPLLFFVALGFGVVFTNLWIIVGVKYCFRYNARNRARQHDENGEPIDLANMPQRRRRREKKLMTIDEVNDRFPITKYKTWVATRAEQGLPTEGGVNQGRAASVRDAEGVIEPIVDSSKSVAQTDVVSTSEAGEMQPTSPTTSTAPKEPTSPISDTKKEAMGRVSVEQVRSHDESAEQAQERNVEVETTTHAPASMHSGDDDEDAIPAAIPGAAEMLEMPGDSCAICIDTLEEDEDVRGLSCGHAFHATCIDPWLTNRRACCPLCKADYYVPKPRPEQSGQEGNNGDTGAQTFEQMQAVRRPSLAAGMPAGGISRYVPRLTGRIDALPPERRQNGLQQQQRTGTMESAEQPSTFTGRITSAFRRQGARSQDAPPNPAPRPATDSQAAEGQQAPGRRWVPSIPNWRRNRAQNTEQATPGQLEAGNTANVS